MTVTDVDNLVATLEAARTAYDNDVPLMSDAEYDALEDQLRDAAPDHPFLKRVGSKPNESGWTKVNHEAPMGSLNKGNTIEEIGEWISDRQGKLKDWIGASVEHPVSRSNALRAVDTATMVVSDKCDGLSLSLKYVEGKLVQALTRGDGFVGEDITRNVLLMKGVVTDMHDFTGHLRGEIVLFRSDHAALPEYKNPRNAAVGISKRQSDPSQCSALTVLHYQVIKQGGKQPKNKATEFRLLEKLGCAVPQWYEVEAKAEAIGRLYDEYVESKRDDIDYDIDGLVIEFNDPDHMDILGDRDGRPKGAIAFKFPHMQRTTTLRDVVWQVGKSGRITPVAIFDPVDLAGATVKQASLHNISNMERLAGMQGTNLLGTGDTILVSRRNDVIPYVEALVETSGPDVDGFDAPLECPSCSYKLERDGEYLVCENSGVCQAQMVGSIRRWVEKLGIKDVGDAVVEAMVAGGVKEIADLYGVIKNPEAMAEMDVGGKRLGLSTAKRIKKNLEAKMELRLSDFLGSLGIPLCGRSMCEILTDSNNVTLQDLREMPEDHFSAIPKVGAKKAGAFFEGLHAREQLIDNLLRAGIVLKKPVVGGKLTGKTFCFSGIRDKPMEAAIADAGGAVKGSVSKTLSYLVVLDKTSTTGKPKKARDYGVPLITMAELKAMLD